MNAYRNLSSSVLLLGLTLGAGTANASIVPLTWGQIYMEVSAGHASNGPYDTDYIFLPTPASYEGAVTAQANDSYIYYDANCDCNRVATASANAYASLSISNNYDTGIFTGSGSISASSTGWLAAGGSLNSDVAFYTDTPYTYTLHVQMVPGAYSNMFLENDSHSIVNQNDFEGLDALYTGTLDEGNTYFHISTYGDFSYTLNLTPSAVPLPAAVWLFGSALLGLGYARRIRGSQVLTA